MPHEGDMKGERVGPYVLEERVARGGMAEVFRARDPAGRIVCVKRLDPALRNDVDFIEMFRDEASLVFDLDHDYVVRMIELVDTEDTLAQVMEFVDGTSLARIRSNVDEPFSPAQALTIGVHLCRALHHVHTRTRDGIVGGKPLSIVHRDVSPQNILVDKTGHLKLVDFGVAKAALRLTRTRAGTLKGKLSYMAPEQARGADLDHRADQFATGILLWEMLTGRRLFAGRNELLVLEQVQKSDAVAPSSVRKGLPRSVDAAVLRALSWRRDERFPDTQALEHALTACLDELGGPVDLSPLVHKALAAQGTESVAVARTRVIETSAANELDENDALAVADAWADRPPLKHGLPKTSRVIAPAIGTVLVFTALAGGVWLAERAPAEPVAASTPRAVVGRDDVEDRLRAAPPHPCRTELLDDLLDESPLSPPARTSIVSAVDVCIAVANSAPQLQQSAKLVAPAWPKKKARTATVVSQRVTELERRGKLALDVGEYERAKALLVEAIDLDPTHLSNHALIGLAFRGLGDPVGAAFHYRLYFQANPNDPDKERTERYLRRYGRQLGG